MKWTPLVLVLLGPSLNAEAPSATIVKEVGEAYLKFEAAQDPQLALRLGLPLALPDLSFERAEADAASAASLLARLRSVKEAELDHESFLSLDVLRQRLAWFVEAPRFHYLRFPVTPYASPISSVTATLVALPIPKRGEEYVRLLEGYPAFIDSIRKTLEGGMARGIVLPQEELDVAISYLGSYSGKSSPYQVGERLKGLPPAEAEAFRGRVEDVIGKKVNPSLQGLSAFLSGDYRKKAPATVGLSQYPGGAEYYATLVRHSTTLDVTPEKVHAIGLAEVQRVSAAMARVRGRVGFKGTATEFRAALLKDQRFFPKRPEEISERLLGHIARIEPKVPEFFLRRPKAPYAVRRLDPQMEAGETFGHYQVPLSEGGEGVYFFNGSKLEDRSLLNAAALIYHELVPGHHFQLCLAEENESLPPFRRELADAAYTEGWGEYSSELAGEMGMYGDPYDLYGRLAMDMFLSTRLVVDTGLNALGWSRKTAVDYMKDHLMETETQIGTESLRYCCDIPSQALAYKMGARKILELREESRKSLGQRFDIRKFHDWVLSPGSLPMTTLERHIRYWVQKEKAG